MVYLMARVRVDPHRPAVVALAQAWAPAVEAVMVAAALTACPARLYGFGLFPCVSSLVELSNHVPSRELPVPP